jgi:hypothetical protein
MLHNSLSRAAKKNVLQPCASVRWHDDQIGRNCLRKPTNFIEWRCATEHIALRRRDAAFGRYLLELFERGLLSVLFIWQKSKREDGRSGRHDVCCVIQLTNMGEMDRSRETPSQLPGDFDRLHRHFREIDWDDDVLNVQRFHAHSMKSLQLAGSALLAKSRAFFATAKRGR